MNARDIHHRETTELSEKPRLGKILTGKVPDWKKAPANDCRVRENFEISVRRASGDRFTAKDPVRFDGGYNFYTYVSNEPINHFDPSGLCEEPYYKNDVVVDLHDSYMNYLDTASTSRDTRDGAFLGFLTDALGAVLPSLGAESATSYYQKYDTKQDMTNYYDSTTNELLSSEANGDPYYTVDYGGTPVDGFTYEGNGVYSASTTSVGGVSLGSNIHLNH